MLLNLEFHYEAADIAAILNVIHRPTTRVIRRGGHVAPLRKSYRVTLGVVVVTGALFALAFLQACAELDAPLTGTYAAMWFLAAVPIFSGGVAFFSIRHKARKSFAAAMLAGVRTVVIDDVGVMLKNDGDETRWFWHSVRGFQETDAMVALAVNAALYLVLPKRLLVNEQIELIKAEVDLRVSPRATGFDVLPPMP